jgi:acetyltransferase-like isoleucine patch superfamily enzyme
MTGREKFKKIKILVNFFSRIFKIFGHRVNLLFLNFFRNTNGNIGVLLRYIFIKNLAKKVGDNVSIQPGVYLFNLQNIEFGNNVSIHPMCYLEGAGGIIIGDDVSIAHASTLISANHTWEDQSKPIKYNPEKLGAITLENDVWVGCGVRILADVIIRERSIIAAGAVVNKSFENKCLIGGVPAKVIKKINE